MRPLATAALISIALTGCDVGHADPARPLPAGAAFTCTPERVWDGDGPIWCREGHRIRLSGIATREVRWTGKAMVDDGCRDGHPCPTTNGVAARDGLVRLLGGPQGVAGTGHVLVRGPVLSCVSTGSAGGKRVGAWCRSARTGDLSCAMVKGGYGLRWDRYWKGHRC